MENEMIKDVHDKTLKKGDLFTIEGRFQFRRRSLLEWITGKDREIAGQKVFKVISMHRGYVAYDPNTWELVEPIVYENHVHA